MANLKTIVNGAIATLLENYQLGGNSPYDPAAAILVDPEAAYPIGSVGGLVLDHGAAIADLGATVITHTSAIDAVEGNVEALDDALQTLALTSTVQYPDVETGRLDTPEGGYFTVRESGDNYVSRWRHVGGVAVPDNALSGKAVTDRLEAATQEGEGQQSIVTDPFGLILSGGDEKGTMFASDAVDMPSIDANFAASPGSLIQTDRFGFIFEDSSADPVAGQPSTPADVADREVANLAYAAKLRALPLPMIQPIMDDWVGIVAWIGQSFSRESEGFPPLTTEVPSYSDDHVLTYGLSPRPWTQGNDPSQITFDPLGDTDLHNLIGISNINNMVLDDAAMAALAPDANVPGEGMSIASTYYLRQQWLASKGRSEAPEAPWLVVSAGVGGKSIAELSKGATPNWYNRLIDYFIKVKAHPDPRLAGKKFYVIAVNISQGQQDYTLGLSGPNNTPELYEQTHTQLRADLNNDIFSIFPDQKFPPAYFISQTAGEYVTDETNLHVATAQANMVRAAHGVYPGATEYPYTNKPSGHLEANGYRWAGCHFGRTQAQVLVHGRNPIPLMVRKATYDTLRHELLIDWLVPEDGLAFGMPYKGFTASSMPNWGLIGRDASGDVYLGAPRILGETVIACTPHRSFATSPWLDIGSRRAGGGATNIMSPSRMIAAESYELVSGAGQLAGANIPALVNKPYPMDHWAWCGTIPVEIV